MTRKGARQKSWTTKDDEFLVNNAGLVSISELCSHLDRSEDSVRSRVRNLRKSGIQVSLRKYEKKLAVCPSCGMARTVFMTRGICKICNLKRLIEKADRETVDALAQLDPGARLNYEKARNQLGLKKPRRASTSAKKLPPKRVRTKLDFKSNYEREKHSEQSLIQYEAAQIASLTKAYKNKSRRLQRIRKKI